MSQGFVKTKSSALLEANASKYEEVIFSSYKKKQSESRSPSVKKRGFPDPIPKREDDQQAFMKKARYDVIKFGMTGFDPTKKQETKEALAISLGAKPKRRKPINYKDLKEMRKKERREEKEKTAFSNLGKTLTGHASAKIKLRQKLNKEKPRGDHKGGLLSVYGKVKKSQLPKKS